MKFTKTIGLCLTIAVLGFVGCQNNPPKSTSKKESKKDHDHGKGPNGGVVFDFGKYHAEFTIDHDKKEAKILFLGDDEKTPVAVATADVALNTKETKTKEGKVVEPLKIKMLPKDAANGKASIFTGTDPGLGHVADHEGVVIAVIDGTPANGKFKE